MSVTGGSSSGASANQPGGSSAASSAATTGVPSTGASTTGESTWWSARSTGVSAAAGLLVVLVSVVVGRPDAAALGAIPVLMALVALRGRPTTALRLRAGPADGPTAVPGEVRARVVVETPPGAVAVRVRVRPGTPDLQEVVVATDGHREFDVVARAVRTGPRDLGEIDVQGIGAAFGSVTDPVTARAGRVMVLPTGVRGLDQLPLPPRLRGLTGSHESRRPGDGGGMRDVHPFAPGDTLRRIDWRVTARRAPDLSELYVRRSYALAEAAVVLVVDSRDDVGPDPSTWMGIAPVRPRDPTSLDLARQAATALAEQYLAQGDRVGLDDLGVRRRPVPPGGGRRQLDRIRHALAVTAPEGEPSVRVRAPRLPSGVLVVLCSTFLDAGAAEVARQWHRAGHRVVAVDVLPTVRWNALDQKAMIAAGLVVIEREDRLAALADTGVEVVTWRDAPAVTLAGLSRLDRRRPGARA